MLHDYEFLRGALKSVVGCDPSSWNNVLLLELLITLSFNLFTESTDPL